MKAVRQESNRPLAPFGDLPPAFFVLDRSLKEAQDAALRQAGFDPADSAPGGEPYLLYRDDCWFTAAFLKKLPKGGGYGRVCLNDAVYLQFCAPLQRDAAHPPIALIAAGAAPSLEGPDLPVDLGLHDVDEMNLHPAVAHASMGKMRSGAAMVHPIEHWTHLLRVNLLAMLSRGEQYRLDFEQAPIWSKLWQVLKVLWNSNGLSVAGLARGLSRIGKGCNIHPTAVVEATELGDGVEVGPFAVLRGCVVGAGAKIEAYGHASLSVIGPKARVGDGAMINLSVLMPEAFVSRGDGFQMSLFGRESFLAVGATVLDLSFGKTIRVDQEGERRDSGVYFLGCCVGHRAKIGNGGRISYGTVVPNDAFLVGPSHDLLRRWPEGTESPARVVDGAASAVRRGDS